MTPNSLRISGFFMGNERDLREILNDVSKQLETVRPYEHEAPDRMISELEAFMHFDDLLSKLHKEYMDAKEQRQKAVREFGADEPMTEVAVLVEDSAWCAVQTRHMELRDDRALMKSAKDMMEEDRRKKEETASREHEKDYLEKYHAMQMLLRNKQIEQDRSALLWFLMGWFDPLRHNIFRSPVTHRFNGIAA